MIRRISKINNFGVYKNFSWGEESLKRSNRVIEFNKLNIIYGRNYSGKTTLSRIFRSLEKRELHSDYTGASYSILLDDVSEINTENLNEVDSAIRVFNKDFVKENLSILFQDDADISAFAVLGGENVEIEKKINELKDKIGGVEEEKGQSYKVHLAEVIFKEKLSSYKTISVSLEAKLRDKARNIKENRDFAAVTYNIASIKNDLYSVHSVDHVIRSSEELDSYRQTIKEVKKDDVNYIQFTAPDFDILYRDVIEVVSRKVSATVTISDFISDLELQSWAKEGVRLNDKRDKCAFCDNYLTESSWERLRNHFNEESEKLTIELRKLEQLLMSQRKSLELLNIPNSEKFYSEFCGQRDELSLLLKKKVGRCEAFFDELSGMITRRVNDIFTSVDVSENQMTLDLEIDDLVGSLNEMIKNNNEYASQLEERRKDAFRELRLAEVYRFSNEIGYQKELELINRAEREKVVAEESRNSELTLKESLDKELRICESSLKDESRGAEKVNSYLSAYFGHESLRLSHVDGGNCSSFQIMRGSEVAKNLSEGESSLIAFCYFIAKLHDLETRKEETIIWIDDPISSLDGSHIFFVFSLIENELAVPVDTGNGNKYCYKQMFLSTHNLEFLKYLKRLSHPFHREGGRRIPMTEYFIIERDGSGSRLSLMPRHLSHYVTEFNYLFEKVKACADADLSNPNYDIFYNFGNNLRKFLESYLFYRYPSKEDAVVKMERFFGGDDLAKTLVSRISNEMSHLEGGIEKGSLTVDVPESQKVAAFVLRKIQEKDPEQYDAFLNAL